jgi:hypothetical protein
MKIKTEKIIFLDIDGVLNSVNSMIAFGTHCLNDIPSKEYVFQLNRIVSATKAKIVISSTWRVRDSYSIIGMLLYAQGLTAYDPHGTVIGTTPRLPSRIRGEEIQWYLDHINDHQSLVAEQTLIRVSNYIILDDDSDMLPSQMSHFLKCRNRTGLTKDIADRAIRVLKAK